MIIYTTKETFERFKLKMPEDMVIPQIRSISQSVLELERGDKMLEWGAKLFYFDRRKCLQVVNFASKLTFFLVDIKRDDLSNVGNLMAHYLMDLYAKEPEMIKRLERFFEDYPAIAFSRLTDRSIIANLNRTQRGFLDDGYRLYEYIKDNTLHTMKINKDFNCGWHFEEKFNGKVKYSSRADKFKEQLLKRYT